MVAGVSYKFPVGKTKKLENKFEIWRNIFDEFK
jgi:hypothetical protein